MPCNTPLGCTAERGLRQRLSERGTRGLDGSDPIGRQVTPYYMCSCSGKSGQALEDSLVLSPTEQQNWFSTRHMFDIVVIYDEDSRTNSYAGGPILDIHQVRLRNLTVAIFDFAGYLKPLKHVPMLLVGGIRAWCQLVYDTPLRPVFWNTRNVARLSNASPNPQRDKSPRVSTDMAVVERQGDDLDLAAESQWLESLASGRYVFSTFKD
jgi:hypothetical protein